MAGLDEVDVRQNRTRTNYFITYKMNEEDELFTDPVQKNLANVKKAAWKGFTNFVPGGSLANVVLDQDERGDLQLTEPKYLEAVPFIGEMLNNVFDVSGEEHRQNKEAFNQQVKLSEYSSGNVVQTEDGPLYRAEGISSVFQMDKDPEPLQRKTPTEAEKELRINRFVNDLAFTVDKVKRDGSIAPTHISKLQPKGSGYDLLGKAKAEWNQWAKRTGFIRELSDRKMTGFVEHLVGKDPYYDIFWKLPNEQRFRKGSRHGPNNVRILLDNRMKTLKDASETILKKLLPKPTKNNLLVFDYDIPRKTNESIVVNTSPRDLVLKRVDGTVVGRLGDYHDVLYAPYQELKKGLSENIDKTTGRPFIITKLPDGTPLEESEIKDKITKWRSKIIRDKIQFIIDEAPTLKGMTQKAKWQYQGSAIQEDMVDFLDKYKDVLQPAKRLRAKLKKEGWDRKYGGIQSEDDKVDSQFLTDNEARRRKLANRRTKSLLRSLFGGERIDE